MNISFGVHILTALLLLLLLSSSADVISADKRDVATKRKSLLKRRLVMDPTPWPPQPHTDTDTTTSTSGTNSHAAPQEDGDKPAAVPQEEDIVPTTADTAESAGRGSLRPHSDSTTATAASSSSHVTAGTKMASTKGRPPMLFSLVASSDKHSHPASTNEGEGDEWWSGNFCGPDEFPAIIFLETDNFASEMAFILFDEASDDDYVVLSDFGDLADDEMYNGQICLKQNACYEFYFFDSLGDGFSKGGLYMDVDGFNALDIRPQSFGTPIEGTTETFWGVYFGRTCGFGEITEPLFSVLPDEAKAAPQLMDQTKGKGANGNCGGGTFVLFEMYYYTDEFSATENSVVLHNIADTGFIWDYPVGSFQAFGESTETIANPRQADYYWAVCLDSTACNGFVFQDDFGDMGLDSGIVIDVNGVEVLALLPDDQGTITGDPAAMLTREYWRYLVGVCPSGI
jgi:hypothetical protein